MDDRDEVLAAARRRAAALVSHDAASLTDLLHPEFRWTSHRGEVVDRDAYVAANVGGSLTWIAQELSAPTVVVVGDAAVLTALVLDEVERDGDRHTFQMRLTQTWVRERGSWRCLAGHAGPPV